MATLQCNTQQFVNFLKPEEVKDFQAAIYCAADYRKLVNHQHISSPLDMDQLPTMKSHRPQDGTFLLEWMQCKIQERHLKEAPKQHPRIRITLNGKVWPKSVQDRFNTFCRLKSISTISIYSHHIIIRSTLGQDLLPLIHGDENMYEGSHLCDTRGCLSEDHLCVETQIANAKRRFCSGIDVHFYKNTAGESCILQVDPCEHGIKHGKANGDFFKYSCRKINPIVIENGDLP